MASKVTTGLVGLKALKQPRRDLLLIYDNILKVLQDIPASAAYRKYTEHHVNERVKVCVFVSIFNYCYIVLCDCYCNVYELNIYLVFKRDILSLYKCVKTNFKVFEKKC